MSRGDVGVPVVHATSCLGSCRFIRMCTCASPGVFVQNTSGSAVVRVSYFVRRFRIDLVSFLLLATIIALSYVAISANLSCIFHTEFLIFQERRNFSLIHS